MPQVTFAATIDAWTRETEARARAVFRESAKEVIAEMQKVGPSVAATRAAVAKGLGGSGRGRNRKQIQGPVIAPGEGGHMPVDSGYLRASLQVGINEVPVTALRPRPDGDVKYPYRRGPISLVIAGAQLGDTIHAAYGAEYAAAIEYGTGNRQPRAFVRLAAMQWQAIVHRVTARVKAGALK